MRNQIGTFPNIFCTWSQASNRTAPIKLDQEQRSSFCVCRQILLNILVQIICLVYLCANHFGADILPRLFVRNQIIYFALDYGQSHGADNVGPRTENFVCVCMQILLNTLVQIFHLQPREHYPSCVGGFIYNLLNTMLLWTIFTYNCLSPSTTSGTLPHLQLHGDYPPCVGGLISNLQHYPLLCGGLHRCSLNTTTTKKKGVL